MTRTPTSRFATSHYRRWWWAGWLCVPIAAGAGWGVHPTETLSACFTADAGNEICLDPRIMFGLYSSTRDKLRLVTDELHEMSEKEGQGTPIPDRAKAILDRVEKCVTKGCDWDPVVTECIWEKPDGGPERLIFGDDCPAKFPERRGAPDPHAVRVP